MQRIARYGEAISSVPPISIIGPANASLMDAMFPSINILHRVGISLFFVGLLVAFGRLTFYLPDNPVPITFQTTGVLLMGGVLGLRWGFCAVMVYYLLGMAGVPVFKDGGNGWHYLSATATAGYLIGFVAAVPLVGFLSERGWTRGKALCRCSSATFSSTFPVCFGCTSRTWAGRPRASCSHRACTRFCPATS